MQDLLSRIDGLTKDATFIGWKFSADGRWDIGKTAYFRDSPRLLADDVLAWVQGQPTANIAFQAMFEYDNGETFFVGVRMTHLSPYEKESAVRKLIASAQPADGLVALIQKICDCLGTQTIAATEPEDLELGVLALWSRVKGLVVWRPDKKLGATTQLLLPHELSAHSLVPDDGFAPLHAPQPNQLMLEAAWKAHPEKGQPFQCWIGLPVTEFGTVPGKHIVSVSRYIAVATAFLGHNPLA